MPIEPRFRPVLMLAALAAWAGHTPAQEAASAPAVVAASAPAAALPRQQEFVPKSGSGRVVVVISGATGPGNYQTVSRNISEAGFDVVLVDGNDFWSRAGGGADKLRAVIAHARAGDHAQPGKVGVVGFSLGGASALTFAARMSEDVATVVVGYPLTRFITDPASFVAKIKVPVLLMAGTADTYQHCCVIDTARGLEQAARAASTPPLLVLHEYPGTEHGFDTDDVRRQDVAAGQDATQRTIAQLKQALGAP